MGFEVRSPQTLTCSTSTHPFPSRRVPSSTDVRKNPRVTIDDRSASTEICAWPLTTFSVVDTNRGRSDPGTRYCRRLRPIANVMMKPDDLTQVKLVIFRPAIDRTPAAAACIDHRLCRNFE